ncbi:hypothetical protein CTI14_25720 [Methylobacterium radiotolerans]|nr:hypothetical protein CTI14_25720 [Methylobacterium radiotolerans]
MSSPSERYAQAQESAAHPETAAFAARQRFQLDPFTLAGCRALENGSSSRRSSPRWRPRQRMW